MNPTVKPHPEAAGQVFSISAFGVSVFVQVEGTGAAELAEHLTGAWAWCDCRAVLPGAIIDQPLVRALLDEAPARVKSARGDTVVAGSSLSEVAGLLTPTITAAALEAASGEMVLLHAAAVADPETGRTVILVGPSGTGKSTAAVTLTGPTGSFTYVTDETVALGHDLIPQSFAKPLSLLPPGQDWGKEQHAPADLRLRRAPRDLTLAAIVFLERSLPAGEEPIVLRLAHHETIARLGENSSYLRLLERPVHRLTEVARATGGGVLVGYHEATDLAPVIQTLLATPSAPFPAPAEPPAALPTSSSARERWTALDRDDMVVVDHYAVTFKDGQLTAVSPLAAAALGYLGDSKVSVTDLTDALVARFGAPEADPAGLTLQVLTDLASNGLVRRA